MAENINNEKNDKSFIEIEDDLNSALEKIGKKEKNLDKNDRVSAITVQDLLRDLKIDEFEKMYITTSAQSVSNFNDINLENQFEKVKTLAEYELSQMNENDEVSEADQKRLKITSNFYLIPHTVNYRYSVGSVEQTKEMEFYSINDVEGNALYNIIDNNISMSNMFKANIKKYLEKKYVTEINEKLVDINEVVEHFNPENITELYDMLGNEEVLSMRFLEDRIDDYLETKEIVKLEKNEMSKQPNDEVKDSSVVKLKNDLEEPKTESYIEKIAKLNHVSPAVVNTRVIENFEKIEEDTGIHLKGRYQRGEVIAVRLPYKLTYRTFLVEKSTGMTIDEKGIMDRKPGKLYDFNEIEDYFRYELRAGQDGGESGIPLRKDEGRDYLTYINKFGEIEEEKFVNNGSKQDMMREERQRYLTESSEVDRKLKDAIEKYQKNATHENYKNVKDLIKEKVNIDNKYNALDKQREVTEKTKENVEKILDKKSNESEGRTMFDDYEEGFRRGRFF